MTISLTEDFKTAAELASETEVILEQVRQSGRPVVVTQGGKPAAVLLDIARYEWMVHLLNLGRLLAEGEASIRAGKTRPAEEVFKELLGEERRANKVPRRNRSRR
ncbi:MAG TPA: type II toxin-antitoxin system prevent-host-death family antitoxin [Gemmataceae bacterium]|nr:type II toxin-antitoxin system prevent-host-death family antitoxin [Gemmataceae bacterium]